MLPVLAVLWAGCLVAGLASFSVVLDAVEATDSYEAIPPPGYFYVLPLPASCLFHGGFVVAYLRGHARR